MIPIRRRLLCGTWEEASREEEILNACNISRNSESRYDMALLKSFDSMAAATAWVWLVSNGRFFFQDVTDLCHCFQQGDLGDLVLLNADHVRRGLRSSVQQGLHSLHTLQSRLSISEIAIPSKCAYQDPIEGTWLASSLCVTKRGDPRV